jgi:hypothetical protein
MGQPPCNCSIIKTLTTLNEPNQTDIAVGQSGFHWVDPPHGNLSLADGSAVERLNWFPLVLSYRLADFGFFFLVFVCLVLKLTWSIS